jgi:hypothetical protein
MQHFIEGCLAAAFLKNVLENELPLHLEEVQLEAQG